MAGSRCAATLCGATRRCSKSPSSRCHESVTLGALNRPDTGGRRAGRDVMPTYRAPVDDVMFLLNDVFHLDRHNNLPGFAEATPDLVGAVLAESAKFCEEVLTPLNRVGDKE